MLSWIFGEKKRKEIEIEGTQEAHVVQTDQNKNMSIGDLDPREEKKGEARAQRWAPKNPDWSSS